MSHKMNKVEFVLSVVATLAILTVVNGIGELCDDDTFCNDVNNERCQRFESCQKGTCVCTTGHKNVGNICRKVAKIDEACDYTSLTGNTCDASASCHTISKQCKCTSGTKVNDYGCYDITKKQHAGVCTMNVDCDYSRGLTCTNLKCSCSSTHSWVQAFTYHSPGYYLGQCVYKLIKYGVSEGSRCSATSAGTSPSQVCAADLECGICPEVTTGGSIQRVCLKTSYNTGIGLYHNNILVIFIVPLMHIYLNKIGNYM